jgi:hypothetical protein
VRVIAIQLGVYKDSRRRIGAEFEMDLEDCVLSDDGETRLLPSWVKAASLETHAGIAQRAKAAEEKHRAAIIYASGTKGAGGSAKKFTEIMHAGRGEQTGDPKSAEAAALHASGTAGAKQKKEALKRAEETARGPQIALQSIGDK